MLSRIASSNLRKNVPSLQSSVRSSISVISSRCLSTTGPDVDVDNYRAEWKTYGDIKNYQPGKFVIQTFNKISPIGLNEFDDTLYDVKAADGESASIGNPHAFLLRSHKLKEEEVPLTVRAIAR